MSDPQSPSAPSGAVAKVLRGSKRMTITRSVKRSEKGMENIDEFWDASKTPRENVVKPKRRVTRARTKKKTRKNSSKNSDYEDSDEGLMASKVSKKKQPNFALPGSRAIDDEDEYSETDKSKADQYMEKIKGSLSPSELSKVSTIPSTTPVKTETDEDYTPEPTDEADDTEEETVAQPPISQEELDREDDDTQEEDDSKQHTANKEPSTQPEDFSMADDDDDDLLPPPPADDEYTSDPSAPPSVAGSMKRTKKVHTSPPFSHEDDDDDDDDDDKEGVGFQLSSPTVFTTTEEEREEEKEQDDDEDTVDMEPAKKKVGRPKKSKSGEAESPAKKPRKTKKSKFTTVPFSPAGIQAGPTEHKFVPVTDYELSPLSQDKGLRRSQRARIKPLEFWKNERPVYGANSATGHLKEAMGDMPVITGYDKAMPTPYKKRKMPPRRTGGMTGKSRKGKNGPAPYEPFVAEQKAFDVRKLKKKLDIMDGQEATIWDEALEESRLMKVIAFASKAKSSELPLPRSRKKHEGKVVGTATQSFNIPSGDNDVSIGYIMGNLLLPPNGIKDPESTGACSQIFTVCSCQPKSVEVTYGDPNEGEGDLVPETAQRFLLSPGDQFRIPPGNVYRLHNHSKVTDSQLAWAIIRPKFAVDDSP